MRFRQRLVDSRDPRIFDQVFHEMLDAARGDGMLPVTFGLALALFPMKYLAESPSAAGSVPRPNAAGRPIPVDSWQRLQVVNDPLRAVQSLAADVDRTTDRPEGVFGRILLQGIDRLNASTVRRWIDALAGVPLWTPTTQGAPFVHWLNGAIDEAFLNWAGEFATPPSIARLMVRLANIEGGARILDPFTGNGTVLSEVVDQTEGASHMSAAPVYLHGQERNRVAWAWTTLRLLLQGRPDAQIVCADSLEAPAFADAKGLGRFDVVLCHGPFGSRPPERLVQSHDPYGRFIYALTRASADSAVVQHAVASLADPGRAIVLVPHGFLFRSGADQRVRHALVESGIVRAVIGLPARTYLPATPIEVAIIVLARGGPSPAGVLFVDASGMGSKGRGRVTLDVEAIEAISTCVHDPTATSDRVDLPLYYSLRSPEEITQQEDSLQPRRYVHSPLDDRVQVNEARTRLAEIEATYRRASEEIDEIIRRLE